MLKISHNAMLVNVGSEINASRKKELLRYLGWSNPSPGSAGWIMKNDKQDIIVLGWWVFLSSPLPNNEFSQQTLERMINPNNPYGKGAAGQWLDFVSPDANEIVEIGNWTRDKRIANPVDRRIIYRCVFQRLKNKSIFLGFYKLICFEHFQNNTQLRIGKSRWEKISNIQKIDTNEWTIYSDRYHE